MSIGVFASGGVDSTMLLYEAARCNSNLYAITIAYDVRDYAEAKVVKPIIEKISRLTSCNIKSKIYYLQRTGSKKDDFLYAAKNLNLNEYLIGLTKSPSGWKKDQGRSNIQIKADKLRLPYKDLCKIYKRVSAKNIQNLCNEIFDFSKFTIVEVGDVSESNLKKIFYKSFNL